MTTIKLDHIAKIEGHAKLNLCIEHNALKHLELEIMEGARFFENICKDKKYDELPFITSRICGVCSPAHTLTSIKAIEDAFGIEPGKEIKLLRELVAIGGLIQSHTLHLYFMVLPDYLGLDSTLQLGARHKEQLNRALRLKRLGNRMITVVGGRDIHPITTVVGGFSKFPSDADLTSLLKELEEAQDDALQTYQLFSSLDYPEFEHPSNYFALSGQEMLGDQISYLDDGKLQHFPHDYETYIKKYFQYDSTAEFVVIKGKSYQVGAQARMKVNRLPVNERLKKNLMERLSSHSPFTTIICQAFEVLRGVEKAGAITKELLGKSIPREPPPPVNPDSGTGIGVSEAPRGLLFHKYTFDKNGYCTRANVTTPTSQNLQTMEECLRSFVTAHLHLPKDILIQEMEKLVRAFDPCISCSSH